MKANDKQINGTHYIPKVGGGVQHWDYCVKTDVPNLEYAASKYVQRWREKNGIIDLNKAIHYLEKRIEVSSQGTGRWRGAKPDDDLFEKYVQDNKIPSYEAMTIYSIMHWVHVRELKTAITSIKKLIQEESEGAPGLGYVNQDR